MESRTNPINRLEIGIVLLFAAIVLGFSLNNAYHIDEPWYVKLAQYLLTDPWRPSRFQINWFGRTLALSQVNGTPPYVSYLIALGFRLVGSAEWRLRLLFLPFDLAAAAALYFLASRYLKRPLLPTLIAIATPAYFINIPHLMCEKFIAAFGFTGLYFLTRAVEDGEDISFLISMLCVAAAMMIKPSGLFLIFTAVGYLTLKRQSPRRSAVFAAATLAAGGIFFVTTSIGQTGIHNHVSQIIYSIAHYVEVGRISGGNGFFHRLRSVAAFLGGCGLVTFAWPWLFVSKTTRVTAAVCVALALILFFPFLDDQTVVPTDRILGIIFSAGALLSITQLCGDDFRSSRGRPLWTTWAASVILLQAFLYWTILARYLLFALPPLIFAMAEAVEVRFDKRAANMIYGVSLAAVLTISACAAAADRRYAAGQKEIAEYVQGRFLRSGRKVWFGGHWGLQYYMEEAGATGLDDALGGWKAVKPGDVVIMPAVNTGMIQPTEPVRGRAGTMTLQYPIPLRLILTNDRQAGFYSSGDGFLPFTLSRDPLDQFEIVEVE